MKIAAIFLPYTTYTPSCELTIAHAKRLQTDHKLLSLEYGIFPIRSHFNMSGNYFAHVYTLAKQVQFHKYVKNCIKKSFNKPSKVNNLYCQNIIEARDSYFYNGVMSSLASKHRVSSDNELNTFWINQLIFLINTSAFLYTETKSYIQKYGINIVGAFNGRFFDSSAIIKAAKDSNIDYFVYDMNRSCSQYYFTNCSLHDIKANQEKALSFYKVDCNDHINSANSYYLKRRNGERTYEKSYTSGQLKNSLPKNISDKKVIGIYPSSDDEYRYLGEDFQLKCLEQVKEIKDLAIYLINHSNQYKLVIRMHPNMSSMSLISINKYLALESLQNIILIQPLDKTDTYALLDHSDIIIGFCSSIISEAAYYGKKTILLGPSPYIGLGMGNEFESGVEAAKFISDQKEFIVPNKVNAMAWAAYINLYNDYLPNFSVENEEALFNKRKIPTLLFWRLMAAFSKLFLEIKHSNNSKITIKQQINFFLFRLKNIIKISHKN